VLKSIYDEKCTFLVASTEQLDALVQHEKFKKFCLASLKGVLIVNTSTPPPELLQAAVQQMQLQKIYTVNVKEGILFDNSLPFEVKGKLLPHLEAKLIDSRGNSISQPNTEGELLSRGYHVRQTHFNAEAGNSDPVFADGWQHSGTIMKVDQAGNFILIRRNP